MNPIPRLLVALLPLTFVATVLGQAVSLERATQIPTVWKPEQHLYVKGNLGVDPGQLNDLETWLDKNAPNWIILLLQNATGEQFTAADGRGDYGMDAVEMAANVATRNQTAFGNLTDPRSGEKNGAVFILFLSERKFSYSGGEAHENRGLGANNWAGNLDQPAFRAMSNGGRIVDAVKATVNEVNSRLTRQYNAEQERRRRELEDAQKLAENAQARLTEAGTQITALEAATATFRQAHPNALGDLASPPVTDLKTQLAGAQAELARNNPKAALQAAQSVADFSRSQLRSLAEYSEAPARFAALDTEISSLSAEASPWGRDRLEEARDEFEKATANHAKGESAYVIHFQNAAAALESARNEIARAQEEMLRQQAEAKRLAIAQEQRERTLAIAFYAALMVLTAGIGVLGYWLNRSRQDERDDAEKLYHNWVQSTREQTDELFTLLDRSSLVVGSAAALPGKGYRGRTLELCQQIVKDVDNLFIMSSTVHRVVNEAKGLIFPGSIFLVFLNLFSPKRYLRALKRLKDEPVRFQPEDGVEPILRGAVAEKPLGTPDQFQPFELAFPALIEACNQHATRARASLETVEKSWSTVNGTLEALQQKHDELAARQSEFATDIGGGFELESVFTKLLPAAQRQLDDAVQQAPSDPVGALETPAHLAARMLDQAGTLANTIMTHRLKQVPALEQDAAALNGLGVRLVWLDQAHAALSNEAEATAQAAAKTDVAPRIDQLKTNLQGLVQRVAQTLQLAKRSRETVAEGIFSATTSVKEARQAFGKVLKLEAGQILAENAFNPDDALAQAARQHAAANAALDRGDVAAAESALTTSVHQTEHALALVAESRQSLDTHQERAKKLRAEHQRIAGLAVPAAVMLKQLQTRFLPTALRLVRGQPEATIEDNISAAEKLLSEALSALSSADADFQSAQLLSAADWLEEATNLFKQAESLLAEIKQQAAALDRAESDNAHDLARLRSRIEAVSGQAQDARTMAATHAAYGTLTGELDSVDKALHAKVRDPFEIAHQLSALTTSLGTYSGRVQSDWKLHEEAVRSLGTARAQLAQAQDLVSRAGADAIADSPLTAQMIQEVRVLQTDLAAAEGRAPQPHGDWTALDVEADRIAAAAQRAAATLRDDLDLAEASVRALTEAANQVRTAAAWSGGYGVSIPGSPGSGALQQARDLLLAGQYAAAQRQAQEAAAEVQRAVAAAEAEVQRHRRAEEERAAARRRAAAARRSFSSGGGGGSSFGGGGRSSFSGGSGMGRSSSGSRSSGMGRSGW